MGQMTLYVDHAELQKAISKVRSYMETNDTNTSDIFSTMESLEGTIQINGKNISNKKESFMRASREFVNNNNSSINVINHTIDMYFRSKNNSVTLVKNEKDKL